MKRKLGIALLVVMAISGIAEAQGFGVQLNYLQSKEKYRIGSDNSYYRYNNHFENGFQVGVFYEYDIPGAKGLGLGVGLNYGFARDHDKGKKQENSYIINTDTTRLQQVLDIPIYLSWRIKFAKEAAIQVMTGPVLSYSLQDKVRVKATYADATLSDKNIDYTLNRLKKNSDGLPTIQTDPNIWPGTMTVGTSSHYDSKQYLDAHIHPFNIMWNVGVGIQYQRYHIRFNYAWGLRNLFNIRRCANDNEAYRLRDRKDEWTIGFAYQLVPKKKK